MILLTAICLILGGLYMKDDSQGQEQGGAGLPMGAHNESLQECATVTTLDVCTAHHDKLNYEIYML